MPLEPCPFCRSVQCHVFECDLAQWAVYCPDCQSIGPQAPTAATAEQLWNRALMRGDATPPPDKGREQED